MTKRSTRITALIAIGIIVGGFILFQSNILREKSPEPTEQDGTGTAPASVPSPQALPVEAIRVVPEPLRNAISVNGSTVPNEEVAITSEVPGKIESILFREGALVKKGEKLIQLNEEELRAERERLVVQRNLNQKIAERLQALYEKEGVSLQDYEVAQAEVEKMKAEIALKDAQLEKRIIRAPFSGRLGLRLVSEGSYLSPGTPIVNLISINPIKLEFDIPEKYSQAVGPGTEVEFRLDGSDRNFSAKVMAQEPSIDPDTRTLRFKAIASNPGGVILPGAFANVTISLKEYDQAIMVPTQAIIPELTTQKVYVYRSGVAQPQEVITGIRQASMIQVTSGLEPGDTVITTGVLQIRPGAPVSITQLN